MRNELQLKTVSGFSLVCGDDLENTPIVGRDEQSVGVFVSEIALQAREELLDHGPHRIIGRVAPTVEWDVDEGLGL